VYGGGSSPGFTGVVLADMDGDGHPDMVVGTQANTIEILHGNADGTFATTSSGGATLNSYPIVLAVADFNSDGVLDLAVEDGSGLGILLGTGSLNYAPVVPYGLGTSSYTFTVADFNRDGHLDCALAAPGGIALLLGKTGGTLQSFDLYDVGQGVNAIASADFNGDHIADIAIAEGSQGMGILLGKGDGTFTLKSNTAVTGGTGSIVLSGDFNGDGKEDLFFTGNNSSGVVLFGSGNGTFGPPVDLTQFQQVGFVAAGVGDFNNDGRSDLVSLNYESYDVLLGQSNETFQLFTAPFYLLQSSIAPAIGDFNKDGHLDMVMAGPGTIQVLLGNGDGTFKLGRTINPLIAGNSACGASSFATADLDGDGNLDLVALASSCAEIFYGNGDGTFQDPVVLPLEQPYNRLVIADVNGDHLPDLVFYNASVIGIVHSAGQRAFSAETHYLPGTNGNIVVQDFNGDGLPDIAVTGAGTTVAVLLNEPGGNLTTGALTVQPEPSTITKPLTMSLSLAPLKAGTGTPTGTVTFSIDGNPVATVSLVGTSATSTYSSSSLGLGQHTITAVYNGDANFVPSYFSAQHQLIPIVYPTTIKLVASPISVLAGNTVSFRATVSSPGQTPYGMVSFQDGTTPLGSVALDSNFVAVFDTALLSPGKHAVTAHYLGNVNFAPVTSSAVNVVVNVNSTSTTLVATPSTAAVGATVLLTATVASSAGTPTGSVLFSDGGTVLQNLTLDRNGVAVCGTTFSSAGTHVLTATYLANASFASSISSPVNVTVTSFATSRATSTRLSAAPSSQVLRGFTLTANVNTHGDPPAGNVIFIDGNSRLGIVALDQAGTAIYASDSFAPGIHYISAFYSGSSTSSASASPVVTEEISADTPDFSLSTSPPSSLVLRGASAVAEVAVQATDGFNQDVALSCVTGTFKLSCNLQPSTIAGGSGTSMLTISVTGPEGAPLLNSQSLVWFGCLTIPVLGAAFLLIRRRPLAAVSLILLSCLLVAGCGSLKSLAPPATVNSYLIVVKGTSRQLGAMVSHTISLQLQIASKPR